MTLRASEAWRVARGSLRVAGALVCVGGGVAGDEATVERATMDGCRRHLLLIHDAVQAYHRAEGDWPKRLSDLAGLTVAHEVLICPECLRRGVFRVRDISLRNIADSDSLTVYKWELNIIQKCPGGETWRELKLKQQEVVKDAVPIVRCDQHSFDGTAKHLNLSLGGDVYPSGTSWEEEFRDALPVPYLQTPGQVFRSTGRIPERVPPRPAGATSVHLDLGPVATALPSDPWQDGTSEDSMEELTGSVGPNGLWEHGGAEFDVRALVQLDGRKLRDKEQAIGRAEWFYPTSPVSIPVGRAARKLEVLGGVVFPAPEGAEVGGLRVRFAGGSEQVVPWHYGREVRDGWHDEGVGAEQDKLAWTGATPTYDGHSLPKRTGPLKVYHWSVEIGRPDEPIEALEFYSSAGFSDPTQQHPSGPFLLGITLK